MNAVMLTGIGDLRHDFRKIPFAGMDGCENSLDDDNDQRSPAASQPLAGVPSLAIYMDNMELEARDFLCCLKLDFDIDAQLAAIRALLRQHLGASRAFDEE